MDMGNRPQTVRDRTCVVWTRLYSVALLYSDYSMIWKLPVNFAPEPAQCQSSFHALWLNTVKWDSKAGAIILPDYCTPIACHSCHYGQQNIHGYKVKVQSEAISASHLSSQPVMMTGWLVSGIVYGTTPGAWWGWHIGSLMLWQTVWSSPWGSLVIALLLFISLTLVIDYQPLFSLSILCTF